MTVAEDKAFSDGVNKFKGKLTDAQIDSLAGKTLTPAIDHDFAEPDWVWSDEYTQAINGCVRLVINAYFDAEVLRPEAFVFGKTRA